MFTVVEHNNNKTISTKRRNANPTIDKTKPKLRKGFISIIDMFKDLEHHRVYYQP
jgi:hypothetical protein